MTGDLIDTERTLVDRTVGGPTGKIQNDPAVIGLLDGESAVELGKVYIGVWA
jgi:hypothetical protein